MDLRIKASAVFSVGDLVFYCGMDHFPRCPIGTVPNVVPFKVKWHNIKAKELPEKFTHHLCKKVDYERSLKDREGEYDALTAHPSKGGVTYEISFCTRLTDFQVKEVFQLWIAPDGGYTLVEFSRDSLSAPEEFEAYFEVCSRLNDFFRMAIWKRI